MSRTEHKVIYPRWLADSTTDTRTVEANDLPDFVSQEAEEFESMVSMFEENGDENMMGSQYEEEPPDYGTDDEEYEKLLLDAALKAENSEAVVHHQQTEGSGMEIDMG